MRVTGKDDAFVLARQEGGKPGRGVPGVYGSEVPITLSQRGACLYMEGLYGALLYRPVSPDRYKGVRGDGSLIVHRDKSGKPFRITLKGNTAGLDFDRR